MSYDSIDNLPSIDDYKVEELPSLESVLSEHQLPSVEEFKEKEEEELLTEEVIEPEPEIEVETQDLTEVLHLINAVRKDIPHIPEIKYYDDQLEELTTSIESLKVSLKEGVSQVREDIPTIPEIRYYDEDVEYIQKRISILKDEISNLPEVKYYEKDIEDLKENIQAVKDSIPKFPKWVNEVNEVPDFSWIGKTFSVIDDDFIKVQDHLNLIKERITTEVKDITETIDVKDFETKVDVKNLTESLSETKSNIYKELKEYALRIWAHHKEFKDDDRKLKKQIKGEYNLLRENIEKRVEDFNTNNIESQNTITSALTEYFNEVKEEIANLPQVKYYDDDIKKVKEEFVPFKDQLKELREMVVDIKVKQYQVEDDLKEGLLNVPPQENNKDPLTPLDQNFVTLQELQSHYKLFVNRVTEQLATFGGGGAVELQYLDDITGIATNVSAYDGMFLTVDTSQGNGKKFKFTTVSAGSTTWAKNSTGIHTLSNVGIGTTNAATALYVTGDATVTGDLNVSGDIVYDEVTGRNLNISGIATLGSGSGGTTSGVVIVGASAGAGATMGGQASGIVTYYGDGSNLTGKASIGLAIALG